jgi:hypothetical protein
MNEPHLLLVHPGSLRGGAWGAGPAVKPELVSVHTHLTRGGVVVDVLDLDDALGPVADAAGVGPYLDRAAALLRERSAPSLVAVDCWTVLQYSAAMGVAARVRSTWPATPIAVFGQHPTVRRDDFTAGDTPFDWVIQGDAEPALLDLARDTALVHEDGHCHVVAGEPFPLTADTLPDFSTFPVEGEPVDELGVYLSRGCQYRDAICYLGPGGGLWYAYPPAEAAQLLTALSGAGHDVVEVLDPTFGFDNGWRRDVLRRLARNDRRAALLSVTARADSFARQDVDLAYAARLHVHFNVGTLSPQLLIRREVPSPQKKVERALDLLRYANAKGVLGEIDLVFGQPGGTDETATETLDALEGLIESFPNTSLRVSAVPWAYFPTAVEESILESPARRFGTRIESPQWWTEDADFWTAAHAVVPSKELGGLPAGDDSYWRPRFEQIKAAFEAKLTGEARANTRSHETVGAAASDVPHGFWRERRDQ